MGVGRQAAGGQPRHRRAATTGFDQGAPPGRARAGRRVPRGDARVRRQCATWTSGTPTSTSRTCMQELRARVDARQRASGRGERGQGAHPRQPAGLRQADHVVDGERRIISDPPLIVPIEELFRRSSATEICRASLRGADPRLPPDAASDRRHLLEQFQLVHVARKVVGVGSVGTRAWIVLMLGRDGGDPLFLQAKEAEPSVLEAFAGASAYAQPGPAGGRRPAAHAGRQRHLPRLATRPGHRRRVDRDFYVRQLRDGKGSARRSRRWCRPAWRPTPGSVRLDAGPGPRPLRRPDRHRRPTSAAATRSTRPWPSSPRPTPTRTSRTSTSWRQPSATGRIKTVRGL